MSAKCLICYCDIPLSPIKNFDGGGGVLKAEDDTLPLLSKHLDVIFILRNIFQLPVTQLSNYLKSCPNVDNWICVCDKCNELVRGYRAIYNDLLDISRKVEETKQGIIGIVKKSYKPSSGTPVFLNITNECRQFIKDREYHWPSNPFTDGDLKALTLLNKSILITNDKDQDKPVALPKNFRTKSLTCSSPDDDLCSNDDDDYKPGGDDFNSDDEENESVLNAYRNSKERKKETLEEWKPSYYVKHKKDSNDTHDCPHCPSKFVNKSDLLKHFKNKHPDCTPPPKSKGGRERKYAPECYTVSETRKRRVRSKVPCKCTHCGKQLNSQDSLRAHIKFGHLRKFGYECATCGVGKPSKKSLESHQALCSAEGPKEKCPEKDCPVIVSMKMGLESHVRDKHPGRSLFSRCSECEEGFYTEIGLERHLKRKHKESRPFKCDICGVGFKLNQSLKYHKTVTHDEEGQGVEVICDLCGARFSNQIYLTKHVRRQHENGFKFGCDQCGKGYSTEELLKVHLFKKHGIGKIEDLKYRCEVEGCSRIFYAPKTLEIHMAIHEGRPPQFTCEECGKQFYQKLTLRQLGMLESMYLNDAASK